MIERREHARFALEPREAIGIAGDAGWQHLQRDVSPKLCVTRAIDLAHAADAEQLADLKRAQPPVRQAPVNLSEAATSTGSALRRIAGDVCHHTGGDRIEWLLRKPVDRRGMDQERLDLPMQPHVVATGEPQELRARLNGPGQRGLAQALDLQSTLVAPVYHSETLMLIGLGCLGSSRREPVPSRSYSKRTISSCNEAVAEDETSRAAPTW